MTRAKRPDIAVDTTVRIGDLVLPNPIVAASGTFGHGDVLIWFFEIFMFVVWFWLLLTVVGDLFRDHEVSGLRKALWIVALALCRPRAIVGE